MKKITCFTILRLALAAFVFFGATACIGEESGPCVDPRGNVRLTVRLDADVTTTRADDPGYHIDHLHIYVFDADEQYVTLIEGGEYTGQMYEFFLDLPAGEYHFVAWTNHGEGFKTNIDDVDPTTRSMSDMQFYLDHGGEILTEHIPDLLHGMASDETIVENRDNHIQLAMVSNTNLINMKMKGLPPTDDEFHFTITDNNSHYTFDNTLIEEQDHFTHSRTAYYYTGEATAAIKTLSLSDDRHPQFTVTRKNPDGVTPDEVLFDQSLTETITRAYSRSGQSVDFSQTYTYNIVLSFKVDMGVTVSVNGWEYEVSHTDL